tara:strand:+ start:1435 stop:2748 length:1314 start_codon:yes stop_codon:yes gene_type:complete
MHIVRVKGREILDSRGNPTVEVDIHLDTGSRGRAAVPSGISTGKYEALELRDKDTKRYLGKGVKKAVSHINEEISSAICGHQLEQTDLDKLLIKLDGTATKSRLGANALLGVSIAAAKAEAANLGLPLYAHLRKLSNQNMSDRYQLPVPMMNILNGGAHANSNVDLQEFMVLPVGASSFGHALQIGSEIFHVLAELLQKAGHPTSVGDEGGFAPKLRSNHEALDLIVDAIRIAGFNIGKEVFLGLDVASSELFKNGKYYFKKSGEPARNAEEMIEMYKKWCQEYPLISIEDGISESDWDGWKLLTSTLGDKLQLVGDDVFATNPKILRKGIEDGVANALLVKFNQIGTLSETLEAVAIARKAGYASVISHRSGETDDTTIADLSVALNSGQIKAGSTSRSDRIAKYNQLLRIEEELGSQAYYAGNSAFKHLSKSVVI